VKNARVLLVDDDAALLDALPEALRLRMDGIRIDVSDSAVGALERIRETDYDAIVSDIKMPGMDGLALLHEIRQLRPTTPTLMITGHGERDLAVQALRGGAYDFVQKPIDRDYFVASLERAIQLRRLDRQVEQQRLALARLLLHAPRWVFFEDIMSSMSEDDCQLMKSIFARELRSTTVVGIGSGPALNGFYHRTIRLRRLADRAEPFDLPASWPLPHLQAAE